MFVDTTLQLKKRTDPIKYNCSPRLIQLYPMAKVYYFKELNCNKVDLSWDYERVISNFKVLSVLIYQELTTDIRGDPN